MIIDYQWQIWKNKLPKVAVLKVTYFWRVFKKSQLLKWLVFKRVTIFKRWLVLKKLSKVTNFNLSHQMIINMWPWHEFHIQLRLISFIQKDWFLSFISLHLSKSFCSILSLSRKVHWPKTCAIVFLHLLLSLVKRFKRLTAWEFFCFLQKISKD